METGDPKSGDEEQGYRSITSGPWPENSAGILTWTWALIHRTAEGADGTCLLRLDGSTEPSWLESLDRDCWSKNARLNSAGALTLTWVLLLFEYAQMNLAAEPRHSQGLQYREPPPTQNQEARAANSVRKTWGGERWRREQRLKATAEKLHRCFNLNMAIDPQSHSKYWWKLLLRIWWLSGTIMAGAAEPGPLN